MNTRHTGQHTDDSAPARSGLRRTVGLIGGPLVFVIMLLLPAPADLEPAAWRVAAIGLLMAVLWISEAIPIPATSLLPIILFPLLSVSSIGDAASPYAHPLIFLFMGGFMLALAMERWNLHKRVALLIINAMGVKPGSVIAGFMAAAAFLSMWVSNTATTMMLLPIGVSVIQLLHADTSGGARANFALTLMLGIAYAASIGGLATLIGTPPNALLAAFMEKTYKIEIGFAEWMLMGVPLVILSLPLVFVVLTRVVYPVRKDSVHSARHVITEALQELGSLSRGEKIVGVVFCLTAAMWIARRWLAEFIPGLSDSGIALIAALALFLIPVNIRKGEFALNWDWAVRLPWGVLLLFGGGLSLADAIKTTGLATWIGGSISGLAHWPLILVIVAVIALIVFLTELTSNTATTAAFLPIMASVAIGIGQNPMLLLVATAVGASCAFMLPVATPPNAIVFGSGYISIPQMSRTGLILNILFIVLLTLMVYSAVPIVFGVDIGVVPPWAL